ncbi:MAG: M20/M25/M40 family metallo-hydrolase [Flammeovirgaceae bacterium]|nr:MAG: M20/M25/M40 family metallo-hydrolase [Flammeovirgaceae bacterium]
MRIIFVFLLLVASTAVQAQQIEAAKIKQHIKILANDSLQGRGTGKEGERMAAAYLQSQFKKLKLKPMGENGTYLQAFPFKGGAHGEGEGGTASNVIAYLDNKAATTIIIGAHYDHLGMGDQGSSLDANPQAKIHNGADDNASGTAGVLELARYFAANKKKEKNNFLFILFSGEELGLLGSKYFTEHATTDLSKINFMINMDMVGRLNPETKTVVVNGSGTSPVWEPLLKSLATEQLKIKTDSSGIGPSDHTSFYLKDIPVLHFFTGSHADYHKPSDDWEKINYDGAVAVLNLIRQVIEKLDGEPKLRFLKTKSNAMAVRSPFKVTMGVMPSYSSDEPGLKVDGVTDGRPAQKAGIVAGDLIIEMGEYPIKDVQSYMEALGKFEKGQTIPVKVKRGGEVLTFQITF